MNSTSSLNTARARTLPSALPGVLARRPLSKKSLLGEAALYSTWIDHAGQALCIVQLEPDQHGRMDDFRFVHSDTTVDPHKKLEGRSGKAVLALDLGLASYLVERFAEVAETGASARFKYESRNRWIDVQACRVDDGSRQLAVVIQNVTQQIQTREQEQAETARVTSESGRKNIFMATMAHELRNAMGPISNALEILRCSHPGSPALPMAERQLAHMTHLVSELLDVGRIVNDQIALRPTRAALQQQIVDAVEAWTPAARGRGHEVAVDMPQTLLWANLDPLRFQQVLGNLLNNAIKYTPTGGLITLQLRQCGREAQLCISDNGVGVEPHHLEGIFDLFRQVRHDQSQDGLGIGLSLVRRLTELHGGTVRVHSPGPGRGTTFELRLPTVR